MIDPIPKNRKTSLRFTLFQRWKLELYIKQVRAALLQAPYTSQSYLLRKLRHFSGRGTSAVFAEVQVSDV